jgi:hypothetical protein
MPLSDSMLINGKYIIPAPKDEVSISNDAMCITCRPLLGCISKKNVKLH